VVAFCDQFRFLSNREPEHEIFGKALPYAAPFLHSAPTTASGFSAAT
jgi:hypothetical protein